MPVGVFNKQEVIERALAFFVKHQSPILIHKNGAGYLLITADGQSSGMLRVTRAVAVEKFKSQFAMARRNMWQWLDSLSEEQLTRDVEREIAVVPTEPSAGEKAALQMCENDPCCERVVVEM